MNFACVLVLLCALLLSCRAVSVRLYFSNCQAAGFHCTQINAKHRITYQCPPNVLDATFYLWNFRSPPSIETMTIKNCNTVRLSFGCTSENRPITQFSAVNITNLFIIQAPLTHNPPSVVFENITHLDYIPENTFSQISRKAYKPGCINPARDFQNLSFEKVNIGAIAPKAFNELKDFYNFSWSEVNVQRVQHLAVELEFNNAGNFSIRKSNLEVSEHLAFKIVGKQALFAENKFVDISPSTINGTIETFVFTINNVNNFQSYGISILSQNVHISDNRFEYLRSGAFAKISPGLLHNSQRSFGSLRFVYDFSHNYVNFVDAGSLNPDMVAYDNVATELKFSKNAFFCSCDNLGWLFVEAGHGYETALLQDFYETITGEEYENTCSYNSCDLPLKSATGLLKNGKCLGNVTAESLCRAQKRTSSGTPPSEEVKGQKAALGANTASQQKTATLFRYFTIAFALLIIFKNKFVE